MDVAGPSRLEARTLRGFIWGQLGHLRGYLFWRLLSVLAVVPFPLITQRIVDVSIPDRDMDSMWVYTGWSLVLLVVHFVSMKLAVGPLSINTQDIFRSLRARIFHKLNFMHFRFLDSTQTGRMLSKYAIDTSNVEMTLILGITALLPELLRGGLMILTLFYINAWLLLFVLLSVPLFAFIHRRYLKPLEDTNHAVRMARERMTGQANEFISAIKLVRGYGQEQVAKAQLNALSSEYGASRTEQMRVNQGMGFVIFTVVTGITILATAFCGWLVISERMTLGAMVALLGALPVCLYPVILISQFSLQYMTGSESYRSIKELLDSGYVEAWSGVRFPQPLRGEIDFQAVDFAYGEDKPLVLEQFTLRIRAGEHVAFVGASGSGKSTLVSLMLGFYAPRSGSICVDGVSQAELDVRRFRQRCAVVMQDNLLLSGTIRDNIRFGRPDASDAEVLDAAVAANAMEFIDTLPEGLDTEVGERGVSLSGGQRQRIAISRALLRDPEVLVLDEATSALDYESERLVQGAIDHLAQGRTTITIAHRLSTIRAADRIVVLKDGRIVEQGSWDELAAKSGAFKDLLNAQS